MGVLSIKTVPSEASYNLEIRLIIDDFPEPVFPKTAMVSPLFTLKLMFLRAVIPCHHKLNYTF